MADSTINKEYEEWQGAMNEEMNHRDRVDRYFTSLSKNLHFYK